MIVGVGVGVGVKALSYALNNPYKEIMCIPTSKDIKFKAKNSIDVQGARSTKATGAAIFTIPTSLSALLMASSIISFGIIAVWIPIALCVGKKNQKMVDSKSTVQ